MKKFICILLVVMTMAVLLAGCKVTTTVDAKYNDGFAANYASATEVDDNGNVSYEFANKQKYEQFAHDYYQVVKEESRLEIKSSGQYSYYNPDITEIVVGITPEAWEEMSESELKSEAYAVGEAALKFQMNMKNPSGKIDVTYRNANTSEEYFTITVEA